MPPALPTFLAVYGLLYAAFGVQSPFLPALLSEQGLHAEEIGIVLAASTAIRVLAGPAVGHVADRHSLTLCLCALATAVAGCGSGGTPERHAHFTPPSSASRSPRKN
jgi:MFS transporter, PPP family, 3-phenylpropionic acid transporter